ncbi:MAG TPA: hypothetical protein PLQ54_16765 [Armatimonadota bacterium]|nr:hypothetical protein [Armatimonadota bacterium]
MARITLTPAPGQMSASATDVPAFPDERFGFGIPECIGDSARPVWFGGVEPKWEERDGGAFETSGRVEGELEYSALLTPFEDHVDLNMKVTNLSDRDWAHAMAFNCFQCGGALSIGDHECLRHWVGWRGELRRLIEVPRHCGPRPAVQLYGVDGAPPWEDIPFVARFACSPPDVALEGWMAIVSRDGSRLVATVSRPCLCLFQNMEYSCIHASPWMGRLGPGETGTALNRAYFVESSLEAWHARMVTEMAEEG